MSSKSRLLIFLISTPLVVLATIGGLLGASSAPQQGMPHLRVFEDVTSLVTSAYVEPVEIDRVMEGAMRGLADGLDPSSAYLSADEVRAVEASTPLPSGEIGLVLTRQFYLRVVGVRDGSPAARAGLRTGDFVRGIDGKPTRELSGFTGNRLLHGAPGSKIQLTVLRGNAAEPHVVDLVREAPKGDLVTSRRLPGGEGYIRVVSFESGAAAAIRKQIDAVRQAGATSAIIDVRGIADGTVDEGIAAARHFVKSGPLATRAGRAPADKTITSASATDGAVTMPIVLMVSNGTANAAELFASALSSNGRADLVGEPTAGIAAVQHLIKLPESRGLWLTYARYLDKDGKPIHERGLAPTVGVEEPSFGFDEAPPTADDALVKAIERLKTKKAA